MTADYLVDESGIAVEDVRDAVWTARRVCEVIYQVLGWEMPAVVDRSAGDVETGK